MRVRGNTAFEVAVTSRLTVVAIPRRFRHRKCPTTAIGGIGWSAATDGGGARCDGSAAQESSHHVSQHGQSRDRHRCIVRLHIVGKTVAQALVDDDSRKC